MREQTLYPPVKAFLEAQGYDVKGEVNGCDVVAVRGEEPPVVVELKTSFSLPLVFQGIARQGLSDNVYLAVPPFSRRTTRRNDALALCRRLGLGLLTVRLEPTPFVEALGRPGAVPAAPAQARHWTVAAGVPAPGGRSDPGWLDRPPDHDRLPAGRPALCRPSSSQRSYQGCRRRRGNGRRPGQVDHVRRSLRLVRARSRYASRGSTA